jgi:hypothetical protein
MPWFSILNKDHSPRPAWKAFKRWREQEHALAASRPRPATASQPATTLPAASAPQAVASPTPQLPTGPAQDGATPAAQAPPDSAVSPSQSPAASGPAEVAAVVPPPAAVQQAGPAPATEPTAPAQPPTAASTASAPPPAPGASTSSPRLRVATTDGTGVNLRARPSADATVVAILMEGTTVDVIGEDVQASGRTWRNVRTTASTTDGVTGWVVSQYLLP